MLGLKKRRRTVEAFIVSGIALAIGGVLLLNGGGSGDHRPSPAPEAPRAQASAAAPVRVSANGRARFRPATVVQVAAATPETPASQPRRILSLARNQLRVYQLPSGKLAVRESSGRLVPFGPAQPSGQTVRVRLDLAGQRVSARVGEGRALTFTTRIVPETGVTSATATSTSLRATPYRPRLFSAGSVWNRRLAGNAPLDGKSGFYAAELRHQIRQTTAFVNTTQYSVPVYTVGRNAPTRRVKLDVPVRPLQRAFAKVPLPAGAAAAGGTDRNIAVYQPSTDSLWEFWLARKGRDGWHARWGGRIDGVSGNPGYFERPNQYWGASATSLAVMGGLIRPDELRRGRIDHALALGVPRTQAVNFSYPAQRTDGWSKDARSIPVGIRYRIDPRLDLSTLKMSPAVRAMAEAAQRYGIVVRETSGAVSFYAEAPKPGEGNPYQGESGLFKTRSIGDALNQEFPWKHIQVLKTQMRTAADTR